MEKETKKYDEDYLNALIKKAKKSWEGVDVDSFMSDLRDMDTITIKCQDLMVGDWVNNEYGLLAQIINVCNVCAYAIFKNDEASPWVFDNYVYHPVPIPLTSEIFEKNGWKETEYWYEYKNGNTIIQCSLHKIWGIINEIEIEHFKCEYVHQLQHLLRLCGLNELANNFKV